MTCTKDEAAIKVGRGSPPGASAGPVRALAIRSAVRPVPSTTITGRRSAMLLAMQGQRGSDAKALKFITATVRVDLDRSRDGQWRVANLTVLKKPQMNTAGQ